jgi:hypothetical protein
MVRAAVRVLRAMRDIGFMWKMTGKHESGTTVRFEAALGWAYVILTHVTC